LIGRFLKHLRNTISLKRLNIVLFYAVAADLAVEKRGFCILRNPLAPCEPTSTMHNRGFPMNRRSLTLVRR